MPGQQVAQTHAEVTVENIGHIDEMAVEFTPGVTMLEGDALTLVENLSSRI